MLAFGASAQELTATVDADAVMNNREGGDNMRPDQTFLFTRLRPEAGLRVDYHGAHHTLAGGIDWYQPINNNGRGYRVDPILYYTFGKGGLTLAIGALPRALAPDEPHYLRSDSLNYVDRRIRGFMVGNHGARGDLHAHLDWRQMQSTRQREAFEATFFGRYRLPRGWWLGGWVRYNHLAKRKNAPEGEGVNDDATINPLLGFAYKANRLSLNVETGLILNLERARSDNRWHTPCGFTLRANAQYRRLEAEQSVYAGGNLFPLYPRFGSELNLGDNYYCDSFYSRTDLRAHIVQTPFVDLNIGVTLHATSHTFAFWQQIACRVHFDLDNIKTKRFGSKKLRTTY